MIKESNYLKMKDTRSKFIREGWMRSEWPGALESSYAAVGAGSNILWIDPYNDLVLVARWIDQKKIADMIGHFVGALA